MSILDFAKLKKKDISWVDKKCEKHEHNYKVHCILEITLATGEIFYYNVHKCNKCNSFTAIPEEDNPAGHILRVLNKREIKLPIITADSNKTHLVEEFSSLKNIKFCQKDKVKKGKN